MGKKNTWDNGFENILHLIAINNGDDANAVNYSQFVQLLVKPGDKMSSEITAKQDFFWNSAIALNNQVVNINRTKLFTDQAAFGRRDNFFEFKHMLTGMIGEVGEIMDVVKSIVLYRKNPLTEKTKEGKTFTDSFIEEVGDFCFYGVGMENMMSPDITNEINECLNKCFDALLMLVSAFNDVMLEFDPEYKNISIDTCVSSNVEKLSKRYHKLSYSDEQAKERADKQ